MLVWMSLSFERDIADESATRARARHSPRPHTLCERSPERARERPTRQQAGHTATQPRARGNQTAHKSLRVQLITSCTRAATSQHVVARKAARGSPAAMASHSRARPAIATRQPLRARIATAGRTREQPTTGRPRAIPCEL